MTPRTFLIITLALVSGGSAAVGVNTLRNQNNQGPGAAKPDTVPMVVAAVDIPRGVTVTATLVKTRNYPKDLVPAGVITKLEDALNRATLGPLVRDEPVIDHKLAPKGT